jgi:hypothetical protein
MKFQDPTEKGETPGYYLPFAKPYFHPKDGWANEHCWHARLPEVRQRNVWSNRILPCLAEERGFRSPVVLHIDAQIPRHAIEQTVARVQTFAIPLTEGQRREKGL